MATQIVIANKESIFLDNTFFIAWADKGKNWVDAWCPDNYHCVIWNNLVGQNEFDGLELKIFKRIAKEFTMRRGKFRNHDCEVRVIKNTAEEILHVSAKVWSGLVLSCLCQMGCDVMAVGDK